MQVEADEQPEGPAEEASGKSQEPKEITIP